jgi:hypothetical protein
MPFPDKFKRLQDYIASTVTIGSVAYRLGAMVSAKSLTPVHIWKTRCVDVPERAMAKLRDPACLARYWTGIVFLNHDSLGSQATEAALAESMAVMDVIRELYRDRS